jgi:hypothetical protein
MNLIIYSNSNYEIPPSAIEYQCLSHKVQASLHSRRLILITLTRASPLSSLDKKDMVGNISLLGFFGLLNPSYWKSL